MWVSFSAANEENFFPSLMYWEAPPVLKKKNYNSCGISVMGCAQGKRELIRNDGSGFLMLELRVEQELAGQIQ